MSSERVIKSRERHNISRERLIKLRERLNKSRERHSILKERLSKLRERVIILRGRPNYLDDLKIQITEPLKGHANFIFKPFPQLYISFPRHHNLEGMTY